MPATVAPPSLSPAAAPQTDSESRLHRQARDKAEEFETVFLTMFIEQMYAGIETDGPFGGGSAEETYRSMLSQEYGKSIARSGGVGITDAVYREILKAQEATRQ
jgi:Rod binding domain-containing protein